MKLRFIERDGKKILQQLMPFVDDEKNFGNMWKDIPTESEHNTVEFLLAGYLSTCEPMKDKHPSECLPMARAAIRFFGDRVEESCHSSGEIRRFHEVLFKDKEAV